MNENNYSEEKSEEWFKKAESDINAVEILIKDVEPPTDIICFHCQQAVEKYLKGYLTKKNIRFIKTHDLDYLLKLCSEYDNEFETYREVVLNLNKYGVEPRYPVDIPVYYSIEEAKKSLGEAKEIIKFIKGKI